MAFETPEAHVCTRQPLSKRTKDSGIQNPAYPSRRSCFFSFRNSRRRLFIFYQFLSTAKCVIFFFRPLLHFLLRLPVILFLLLILDYIPRGSLQSILFWAFTRRSHIRQNTSGVWDTSISRREREKQVAKGCERKGGGKEKGEVQEVGV